jgi:hypothetical protein
MIIFDKFGDGQSERNRSVPIFPDSLIRIVTPASNVPDPRSATRVPRSKTAIRSSLSDAHGAGRIERERGSLIPARCLSFVPSLIRASRGSAETSNRELDLLERALSHCKQREATVPNRELSTVCNFAAQSALTRDQVAVSLHGPRVAGRETRSPTTFLPGSAQYVECDVTPTKQTIGGFLPGATTACNAAQSRAEFRTESRAQREKDCRSRDAAEQGKIRPHMRNEKELL